MQSKRIGTLALHEIDMALVFGTRMEKCKSTKNRTNKERKKII